MFTLINISGLTFGLASCLLIGLFVWDERQYNGLNPDADTIYRIYLKTSSAEGAGNSAATPPTFAPVLKQEHIYG